MTTPASADSAVSTDTRPDQYQWFSTGESHIGHWRRINEDAWLDSREQRLWVVADGMGGHSRGDRASQIIIASLAEFRASNDADHDLSNLMDRLEAANLECRDQIDGQVMGSTVAVLYVHGRRAFLLWAGDSRIYRYRHRELRQLTDDHSLVQELHRLGELSAEEAENHPSSNVITRAVGVNAELEVQIRETDVQPGDRFLLCSDGLFKDLQPLEVAEGVALSSPQHAMQSLLGLALKRGGKDNVTLVIAQAATTPE